MKKFNFLYLILYLIPGVDNISIKKDFSLLKKNIVAFARPNATEEIVDTLIEVVYGRA